ncbi:hypothetical protein [Thauera sinica]|uniref:hypothetical protein n=1 Tax=Thauera sp. K11 TaxID=2005884 RepID=UPI0012FD79F7|nr:hypothetical protein [Thauera sp. K11]
MTLPHGEDEAFRLKIERDVRSLATQELSAIQIEMPNCMPNVSDEHRLFLAYREHDYQSKAILVGERFSVVSPDTLIIRSGENQVMIQSHLIPTWLRISCDADAIQAAIAAAIRLEMF